MWSTFIIHIKRYFVALMLLVSVVSYTQSHTIECDSTKLTFDKAHVDYLKSLIERAQTAQGEDKARIEQQFFCATPDTFIGMLDLIDLESTLVYNEYKSRGNIPPPIEMIHPFVAFYSKIQSVAPESYYNKYIDFCWDGDYMADHIYAGFQIYERLESDTETFCNILLKRKDHEIKGVFHFIFDTSHPDNEFNRDIYNRLYPLINNHSQKLGRFFKESLENLIKTRRH